jgi:hypothetical protein
MNRIFSVLTGLLCLFVCWSTTLTMMFSQDQRNTNYQHIIIIVLGSIMSLGIGVVEMESAGA